MNLTNAALGGLMLMGPPLVAIVLVGLMWWWAEAHPARRSLGRDVFLLLVTLVVAVGCAVWILGSGSWMDEHFPLQEGLQIREVVRGA